MIDMAQYLLQLQEDQRKLQTMLEQHRAALEQLTTAEGKASTPEELRPSVRLMHRTYIHILEDALSTVDSLTDYLTDDGDRQ